MWFEALIQEQRVFFPLSPCGGSVIPKASGGKRDKLPEVWRGRAFEQ